MISNMQDYSKIPLFTGVDEEGGTVVRISGNKSFGVKKLPAMASIGNTNDPEEAHEVGAEAGELLKKYGFNVNFAPVADIMAEGADNDIGTRAFSSDPKLAAKMTKAYVEGIKEQGVCAMLKHFPGSGNASADPHNGYSQITKTHDELAAADFLPFTAGIEAGADFVMISHITAVELTDGEEVPSTLSSHIINDILRNELGFEGLVITDSLEMGAITEKYDSGSAAVKAVAAGADIILMPEELEAAHTAVVKAVEDGRISEARINESVKKILEKKLEMGIFDL